MKNIFLLVAVSLFCMQCNDDPSTLDTSATSFSGLVKVTTPTQVYEQFEYNTNGQLVKESVFLFSCEVPTSVYSYSYTKSQLNKINSIERGFYSSTSALCDPSTGEKTELSFEYDNKGRISKVVYPVSYFELEYNSQDQISKLSRYANGQMFHFTTFTYDASGNILTETDKDGSTVEYKYDDKINPYYLIKKRPHFISAFNSSPNNVIEASGARSFKRSFKYNNQNLPTEVLEDNSITYTFHYN